MKIETSGNDNLQSFFFRVKIPFCQKSFQLKTALYNTPSAWVHGYSSRCNGGGYVLFFDYDDLSLDSVIEELTALQEIHLLSEIYVFELPDKKDSYHAVCLDIFPLAKAFQLLKSSSCDSAFINAPLNLGMREWVLRIGKKGNRKAPKYLLTLKQKHLFEQTKSNSHAIFLEKYFKVKISRDFFFDKETELQTVCYNTANRVKGI